MLNLIYALIFTFSFAQEKISGVLYDLKSNQTKKLYTLDIESSPTASGQTQTLVQYKDLDGKLAVEESSLTKGAQLEEYKITRAQTNEKGVIKIADGKIFFEYEGKDKKKNADEKVKGKVLCSGNFAAFVKENWATLMKGEAIDVRYAVWDRLETVGFTLQKMNETEINGKKAMELRMKPTSFVIAALVDPVHIWYSMETQKVVLLKGRVPPKKEVDGKWKDLDAEVVYNHLVSDAKSDAK